MGGGGGVCGEGLLGSLAKPQIIWLGLEFIWDGGEGGGRKE